MMPAAGAHFFPFPAWSKTPPARLGVHQEAATLVARIQAALTSHGALAADESIALRARMTPLDAEGRPGVPRDVRLRLLDQRGLAFEHPAPLADRRAWVSVESPAFGVIAAEIELSWCRYNEGGRYTSGGRFVQFGTPPE